MIITEIVPVTKQKCRIVTDEQLTFALYKGELSHYHLKVDCEIKNEVWEEIKQILVKRAKLRAMHLLTKKDYTVAELYKKLLDGEYTHEYVQNYINYHSGKKSRRQIQFELERKGIVKDIIDKYQPDIEDMKNDEIELIRNLLRKRCKSPEEADEKEKSKHYMYLMRKGFQSSDIMNVFQEFF